MHFQIGLEIPVPSALADGTIKVTVYDRDQIYEDIHEMLDGLRQGDERYKSFEPYFRDIKKTLSNIKANVSALVQRGIEQDHLQALISSVSCCSYWLSKKKSILLF